MGKQRWQGGRTMGRQQRHEGGFLEARGGEVQQTNRDAEERRKLGGAWWRGTRRQIPWGSNDGKESEPWGGSRGMKADSWGGCYGTEARGKVAGLAYALRNSGDQCLHAAGMEARGKVAGLAYALRNSGDQCMAIQGGDHENTNEGSFLFSRVSAFRWRALC